MIRNINIANADASVKSASGAAAIDQARNTILDNFKNMFFSLLQLCELLRRALHIRLMI
jgi:hypothetical protein